LPCRHEIQSRHREPSVIPKYWPEDAITETSSPLFIKNIFQGIRSNIKKGYRFFFRRIWGVPAFWSIRSVYRCSINKAYNGVKLIIELLLFQSSMNFYCIPKNLFILISRNITFKAALIVSLRVSVQMLRTLHPTKTVRKLICVSLRVSVR
jgi:hypothetical protein